MPTKTKWRNRIVGTGEEAPDQLVANPLNWRTHPGPQRDALRGSLNEVGWVQQVLVNKRTGNVVDGHARVEEALSRHEATVPVLYVDLDEAEERLVLASLDPIGAMAQRDDDKLRELLADLTVDDEGLQALLDSLDTSGPKVGLTDPDDVPELGEETHIKRGDLFALGDHRLMCGDSTDAGDVNRLMDGQSVDLLVTSPPYHVGIDYSGHIDRGEVTEYLDLVRGVVAAWVPVMGIGRFVAWNVGVSRDTRHFEHAMILEQAGLTFWREIVWVKSGVALPQFQHTRDLPVARNYHPHYRHELIYLFANGSVPEKGSHIVLPLDGESDVWEHVIQSTATRDIPAGVDANAARKRRNLPDHPSKAHPAVYPVALPSTLAGFLTAGDEAVADPFAGSGTTIIAAETLGRRCYAMEIDPRYVAVAIKRWEDFTGKTSERLDGG